jgi:hypothetical protein
MLKASLGLLESGYRMFGFVSELYKTQQKKQEREERPKEDAIAEGKKTKKKKTKLCGF